MARMKTFFMYFLILVAFYIISNFLIDSLIKTSYSKITEYEIDVKEATVTIIEAKSSKDDGYIEGKISNPTKEDILNRYMVVELFSENNVSLGTEYVKIDRLKKEAIKDFKVRFTVDNVKSFKITLITDEEKAKIDSKKDTTLFKLPKNERTNIVENVIDGIDVR